MEVCDLRSGIQDIAPGGVKGANAPEAGILFVFEHRIFALLIQFVMMIKH
jgi:hypothetical protein